VRRNSKPIPPSPSTLKKCGAASIASPADRPSVLIRVHPWFDFDARYPLCYIFDMATSIDTSAFARGFQSVFQLLSPDQVEKIRHLGRDEELERRVAYLAVRANEGELTPNEESEYQGYVEANSVLAGFLAAARLQKPSR
jgi:hypothetical protein